MKTRNGFVSNSSSSSFLIYGAKFDINEALEAIQKVHKDVDDVENFLSENSTLTINYTPYEDDMFIGRSWGSIADDETGKDFKTKIETEIKRIFGEDTICSTFEESFYDG